MKKALILVTALALGGSIASAQSLKAGAPDAIVLDLGVTTAPQFSLSYRPTLNLYGNVSVQERLLTTKTGDLWGTLVLGNSYNDFSRLYVEGQLDYQVNNVTVYGALRQGFFSDGSFGNAGTNLRLGTQVRF